MATAWMNVNPTTSSISARAASSSSTTSTSAASRSASAGNSPQPGAAVPGGWRSAQVNTGSATYPFDVMAALDRRRKTLTVAVVNPTESAQSLELTLEGFQSSSQGRVWSLVGKSLDATNAPGKQPDVVIKDAAFDAAHAPLPAGAGHDPDLPLPEVKLKQRTAPRRPPAR